LRNGFSWPRVPAAVAAAPDVGSGLPAGPANANKHFNGEASPSRLSYLTAARGAFLRKPSPVGRLAPVTSCAPIEAGGGVPLTDGETHDIAGC